jgi:hypothetical protein
MPESGAHTALDSARHEARDFDERLIWIGIPALVAAVVGLGLLVVWLFPGSTVDKTVTLPLPQYPSPQLQADPVRDMQKFREQEMRALDGTGWIDRAHGIAHIPISDAMRLTARDGIPGWPTPSGQTSAEQSR